jgi:hemolysin activation/secretion protein
MRKAFITVGCILFACTTHASAQTPPVDDPARRLLEEERARQRDERLTRPLPEIDTGATANGDGRDDGRSPAEVAEVEPTFVIDDIVLRGNSRLSRNELETVLAPFRGQSLGRNRINLLLRRLTALYLEHGYFTTRCYLGEQNLSAGVLTIDVVEGRLEGLRYRGGDPPLGVRLAFPVAPGDILRLQDIEQGIEQMNRLRRNRATLTVSPGERAGGSLIDIQNEEDEARHYSIGIDNGGQRATGETRLRLGANADDLLGLQENLGVSYTGTNQTNALLLSASIPFGYQTFSYTFSYSDYMMPLGGYALLFGDSVWHNLGWNLTLARDRAGRDGIDVALAHRQGERFINDTALTPQRLTTLRLAFNRYRQTAWGAWIGEIAYTQGIGWFGADRDAPNQPRGAASARFRKFNGSLDLNLPLGQNGQWRTTLNVQWTRSGLYGAEQMFLGGTATVRGFDESGVSGDRGILMRNDLAWSGPTPLAKLGIHAQPYLFVDAGRVKSLAADDAVSIAGAGAGVRLGGHGASADLILGWPLLKPHGHEQSGPRFAFTLTYFF